MNQNKSSMSMWKRSTVAFALTGTMLLGLWSAGPVQTASAAVSTQALKNVVSVSGTGTIEVTPDVAYIDLGAETRANTAAEAQQKNAEAFNKVKQELTTKYGVQAKDIKTTNFSVEPVYKYQENKEPQIVGYEARHFVKVTYRQLDKLGELLDAVSKAGANRISNVNYDTEKREDYEAQVLEKAVSNAQKKANALAKAAGRSIDSVVNIVESGADWSPVSFNLASDMIQAKSAEAVSAPQGGLIKLKASVNVQYQMK
ncbi:SIMPL domain-containing protein [Paenibacillus sp. 481]|uniref:SIMPL domain-containing protein n=1 Tax=Paenibacillus sp. 481 TaxID=2835869 RepID=UPI001E3CE4DA|nr:SIMPL domain-containing protein [Paenibacillus sp. 481]UHA75208.1 SIMPL domain-containing protein [Paenibacillus sp. 481]